MKYLERYSVWVSEDGKVFSKDKAFQYAPQISRPGYRSISLKDSEKGKRVNVGLHRLVAMAHIPNPENKSDVNHKDGDKGNNCLENLEWCTRSENIIHAIQNGLINISEKRRKMARHKAVHELSNLGYDNTFLSEAFGCSATVIWNILNKQKHFSEDETIIRQET